MDHRGAMASSDQRTTALLNSFIERHLLPVESFIGAVLLGSRAHDEARPSSDVDVLFIFEEVDERVVPGEFVWVPADDSFHSIFEDGVDRNSAIQIDAVKRRLSWREFDVDWPEGFRHDLSAGRVLAERGRDVSGVIAARTHYPDDLRLERLGEAAGWADYHLTDWRLEGWVERGGWLCANDQIDAAFEQLISALHAYNRTWLPWRYRRLKSTLGLPWLPAGFESEVDALQLLTARDVQALRARAAHVADPLTNLLRRADEEGLTPGLTAAAARPFSGLGFASNMEAWRKEHAARVLEQENG